MANASLSRFYSSDTVLVWMAHSGTLFYFCKEKRSEYMKLSEEEIRWYLIHLDSVLKLALKKLGNSALLEPSSRR